jgi:hypothetical protein
MDGMARSSQRSGSLVRCHLQLPPPNIVFIIGNSSDVFDGTMITLAMWTLNLFHPGIYLRVDDHPSPAFSEGDVRGDHEKPTPTGEESVTNSSAS